MTYLPCLLAYGFLTILMRTIYASAMPWIRLTRHGFSCFAGYEPTQSSLWRLSYYFKRLRKLTAQCRHNFVWIKFQSQSKSPVQGNWKKMRSNYCLHFLSILILVTCLRRLYNFSDNCSKNSSNFMVPDMRQALISWPAWDPYPSLPNSDLHSWAKS